MDQISNFAIWNFTVFTICASSQFKKKKKESKIELCFISFVYVVHQFSNKLKFILEFSLC